MINKLLEEKVERVEKVEKVIVVKPTYEDHLNHFMRNNHIELVYSHEVVPIVKPQTKNSITQQPQINYNNTSSSSTTSNKYSQKGEQQQNTQPQNQGHNYQYSPYFLPHTLDQNNPNQYYPQMVPQFVYMVPPNYAVILF